MNNIDLAGKRAVVTGGAQGIGAAIAERFIRSGADVALWDRDEDLMAETVAALDDIPDAGAAVGLSVDVTDPDAIADAVERTRDSIGGLDILVCNAGISGPNMPVAEYPIDEWRRVIELDLNAVFYCCRAVIPGMQAQNYGRIVNIASIAGKEGNPNASAYSSAKAGVIGFTKSLGKENAKFDIGVNCVTPAAARTAIFDQMTEAQINYMLSKIPRERFVLVEEIASLVAWLSSADNSFTTGGVFDISGGRATY